MFLLTPRLNSTSTWCKNSTKTIEMHKNGKLTKEQYSIKIVVIIIIIIIIIIIMVNRLRVFFV